MKRRLLKFFKLSVYLLAMTCLLTACSNEKNLNSSGSNTSVVESGSNTSVGESGSNNSSLDNSTSNNKNENPTSSQLEKNIISSGAVTDLGKLVVFVKNNNNIAVDMEIEVEFYDISGKIVGSASEDLQAVGANGEAAVEMWSTPDYFDNYKIYIDVERTTKNSYFNQLELNHSNNGKEIVVQVKNNSNDIIDYITVSVVYYQGDRVVGIDDSIKSDIKSGRSANFNLDFPYNKSYNDVSFDTYKVFITEAYSYNW